MSESWGLVAATTKGTNVTSGTAGNFGLWTTVGTATADFNSVDFLISDVDTSNIFTIDLRIGGSTVIMENLTYKGQETTLHVPSRFKIPFGGVNGNTIECGTKNAGASRVMVVSGAFCTDEPYIPANVQSGYGYVTVDPGGTAHTVGTLVEITTASGLDEYADYLIFSLVGDDSAIVPSYIHSFARIYTGGPGSQVFSGIEWLFEKTSSIDNGTGKVYQTGVNRLTFAAGTRVWIAMQCDDIEATDRLTSFSMHAYQINKRMGAKLVGPGGGMIG